MDYPDWIIKASEIGGAAGLFVLWLAILYVAHLLHRFQKAGRSAAVWTTIALGFAGAFAAAIGLTLLVGAAHDDHASGGAAIGWMMMIGYPALILAGPVALIAWAAALISADRARSAAGKVGNRSAGASAQRRGRFLNRG